MILSLIVAMDEQGVIGIGDRLPWRLSADMKYFKSITMGKPVLMGRKTHASIGRPLPGRENIVISRTAGYRSAGCLIFMSLEDALAHCSSAAEVMVIGGAEVYRQSLDLACRIYLTEVHTAVAGDVRFPEFRRGEWRETDRRDFSADENNQYDYSFVVLERV